MKILKYNLSTAVCKGGVIIWQPPPAVRSVRGAGSVFGRFGPGGCVREEASLSRHRLANGHLSQSEQKKENQEPL